MKKKMILLMAIVMLFAVSAGVSLAEEASDEIISMEEEFADVALEAEEDCNETGQEVEAATEALEIELDAAEQVITEMYGNAETIEDEYTDELSIVSVEEVDDPDDEAAAVSTTASGTCGDNLTWTLKNGVLTISGTGEMMDIGEVYASAPWSDYKDSITSVVIEKGVTSISGSAFYECSQMTSVSISSSVTSIGTWAFYRCASLTNVSIPESVSEIKVGAFMESGLTSIVIPSGVTTIDSDVFYSCSSLTTVTISSGVTMIGTEAFRYCSSLTSVSIPSTVTAVGSYAFADCESLEKVTIAEGVPVIGAYAFVNCPKLSTVTIPDSVKYVASYALGYAMDFDSYYYGGLDVSETVTLVSGFSISGYTGSAAETYANANGISFTSLGANSGSNSIVSGVCGDDLTWTLNLKSGLLTISGTGPMAGYYLNYGSSFDAQAPWLIYGALITSVEIESGVTTIDNSSFSGCVNLVSVTIPDTVTTVNHLAFSGCTSLKSVTIPASVTSIGVRAFGYANSYSVDPEFQIIGYSGTTAETYASENGITFVSLGEATAALANCEISSLTNTSSGIKIKWTAVDGAEGYYIYRKTSSGSYSRIKTIKSGSTISYTDKKVKDKNGTTYIYKVVPYSDGTKGSGMAKTTVRLTGTSLKSLTNSATTKVKVKWTAVSDVTGYQLQYSTSKSFATYKTKKVSGATSASKALRSLTLGKTYYVRIRTYKTVNGTTYYSAWSSKLKVKISK